MFPFIIAEIGVNHNGSVATAQQLILSAKHCGASAVKFQTFSAKRLATSSTPKVNYQVTNDGTRSHFDMLQSLELTYNEHLQLKEYSDSIGIEFMSTPYSVEDAEFLDSIDVRTFKIASADIVDLPLIEFISKLNKLTLMSTGMANAKEIEIAVKLFKKSNSNLILMHTTSSYPTLLKDANMLRLKAIKKFSKFGIGFSDHTLDSTGAIVAVGLGCSYFEKHFTLNKKNQGPDHATSLEPEEFKKYVDDIKGAFYALGTSDFRRTDAEEQMASTSRKSLHYAAIVEKGETLKELDLKLLRPGNGFYWHQRNDFIGRRLKKRVKPGDILSHLDFD